MKDTATPNPAPGPFGATRQSEGFPGAQSGLVHALRRSADERVIAALESLVVAMQESNANVEALVRSVGRLVEIVEREAGRK